MCSCLGKIYHNSICIFIWSLWDILSNFSFYQLKTVPLWSEGGAPCHSYRNPALPGEYIRPLFLLRHEEYDLFKFDGYIPYLNIKQVSEFSETEMRSCVCKTGRSDRLSLASEIAPPWTDKKRWLGSALWIVLRNEFFHLLSNGVILVNALVAAGAMEVIA